MKQFATLIAVFLSITANVTECFGQGTLLFNNFVPGQIDSPVFINELTRLERAGPAWHGQLLIMGADGKPIPASSPITPFQNFPNTTAGSGYLTPVVVTIPNTSPGQEIQVSLGVFSSSFSDFFATPSTLKGSSSLFTVRLGDASNPGLLTGLTSVTISVIPEPSTYALLASSLTLFLILGRYVRRDTV